MYAGGHIEPLSRWKKKVMYLRKLLQDNSVHLVTSIGHSIPRDHAWEQAADFCKRSGGGWSVNLAVWLRLVFPKEGLERALLPSNKKGTLISINAFEMVCVVVNMPAAIFVCDRDGIYLSSYNWCDNAAACTWININCKHSMLGRWLCCVCVG